MDNLQRYPKYKDSGVEWIGEVPEGWEVKKLKYCAEMISLKVSSKDSPCEYIGMENIESWTGKFISSETEVEGLASCFKSGDVLFGKLRPYLAKVYLTRNEGICSTEFLVYRTKDQVYNKHLQKLMLSHGFINLIDSSTYGSKMPRANPDFIGNQIIPIPPLPEQTRIAQFLDRKTAQLGQAIAQKERLIELLKERRQILIHNAVTRGLNPDVKMKDSGVEWIGMVPEHWEVKRSKFIFDQIQTGTTPSTANPNFFDGDIDWYNPKDLNNEILREAEKKVTKIAIERKEVRPFTGDSILVVGIGGTTGKTSYMLKNGTFNQQITGLHSKKNINKYYFHLLRILSSVMLNTANYTTLPILNNEFFKSFILPEPPRKEQNVIFEYIEIISSKIDTAIACKQAEIEKLKEYKATLINSSVTGKIKVG